MSVSSKIDLASFVVHTGLDNQCREFLGHVIHLEQTTEVHFGVEELLEKVGETLHPHIIFVGMGPQQNKTMLNEIAQLLRMQVPEAAIFFVTTNRADFHRHDYIKNGFTEAFVLPLETAVLKTAVDKIISDATGSEKKKFRSVFLVDIGGEEPLDYDVYLKLALNGKQIKIVPKNESIEPEMIAKMKKHNHNSLAIPLEQSDAFFKASAKRLANLGKNTTLTETEKKEKMGSAVRGLFANLYEVESMEATVEKGAQALENCREIIKNYVKIADPESGTWFDKLQSAMGIADDSYNHSANVSSFASMFSMALGKGNPEEVALAGLLHDLGLADVKPEVMAMDPSQWSPADKREFEKHVDYTLNMIRFRKMIIPEKVMKAIAQHHEKMSGTGYPKGIPGDRICIEAQIIALADRFEELMFPKKGMRPMNPIEALETILMKDSQNPSEATFDAKLIRELLDVLKK